MITIPSPLGLLASLFRHKRKPAPKVQHIVVGATYVDIASACQRQGRLSVLHSSRTIRCIPEDLEGTLLLQQEANNSVVIHLIHSDDQPMIDPSVTSLAHTLQRALRIAKAPGTCVIHHWIKEAA